MTLFYLSFANETFLGGLLIEGNDVADCVRRAHDARLNPGGEVLGAPVPDCDTERVRPFVGRLLSKVEVSEIWDDAKRLGDIVGIKIPEDAMVPEVENRP